MLNVLFIYELFKNLYRLYRFNTYFKFILCTKNQPKDILKGLRGYLSQVHLKSIFLKTISVIIAFEI